MNSKPNHKVTIVTADTREELYNIMKQRAAQRKLAKEQRTAANLLDRGAISNKEDPATTGSTRTAANLLDRDQDTDKLTNMSDITPCVSSVEKGELSSLKKTYKVVIVPSESAQEILARRKEAAQYNITKEQNKRKEEQTSSCFEKGINEVKVNVLKKETCGGMPTSTATAIEVRENIQPTGVKPSYTITCDHSYTVQDILARKKANAQTAITPTEKPDTIPEKSHHQQDNCDGGINNAKITIAEKPKGSSRITDEEVKSIAMKIPIHTYLTLTCGPSCCYEGKCLKRTTLGACGDLRRAFWGRPEEKAPSTSERRRKIEEIFENAICRNLIPAAPAAGQSMNLGDVFTFIVPDAYTNSLTPRRVCEAGYIQLIGLAQDWKVSTWPRAWTDIKKEIVFGTGRRKQGLSSASECSEFNAANPQKRKKTI